MDFWSLAREHVARSLAFFDLFFFFAGGDFFKTKKLRRRGSSCVSVSLCSLSFSLLSFFLSFSFERGRKKHKTLKSFDDALLNEYFLICETHAQRVVVFVALYCFYYIQW